MAFSLQYWVNYTSDSSKLQRKSEMAVSCDRVMTFNFEKDLNVVNANVQASMKDKSYKVQVCGYSCFLAFVSLLMLISLLILNTCLVRYVTSQVYTQEWKVGGGECSGTRQEILRLWRAERMKNG